MKLVQFLLPGKGRRVGLVRGDRVLDLTAAEGGVGSTLELIIQGRTAEGLVTRADWLARRARAKPLDWPALQRALPSRRHPHLLLPLDPPEVWGADGTYQSGAAEAPTFFFKATGGRCVGPGGMLPLPPAGRIVPEAELGVVVGAGGAAVAYTAANDLTDADALAAGPANRGVAKILRGGCALGPCLVTADELADPDRLQVRCALIRGGGEAFAGTAHTSRIDGGIGRLLGLLAATGPLPPGGVLLTGSGIGFPDDDRLRDGDRVEIEIEGVGRLSNPLGLGRPSGGR